MVSDIENIYATCVAFTGKAILLTGKSGSGKSDLALRLIMDKGAVLVADDRVDVWAEDGVLWAAAPQNIKSMIEVRGVGICNFACLDKAKVSLAVELVGKDEKIERLPEPADIVMAGVKIPVIKICPFEASAVDKVLLACK